MKNKIKLQDPEFKGKFTIKIKSNSNNYNLIDFSENAINLCKSILKFNFLNHVLDSKDYNLSYLDTAIKLTRYNDEWRNRKENAKNITIERINNGSIVLILSGLTLLATIFVPYHIYYLQCRNRNKRVNDEYIFVYDHTDPEISKFLKRFQNNEFGDARQYTEWAINILEKKGYHVTIKDKKYIIDNFSKLIRKSR